MIDVSRSTISGYGTKGIKGATCFDLRGAKELERMLKDFPKKIQETVLDASVRAGASLIRKEARKNLRQNRSIKSGRLYKSFKTAKIRGTHGHFRIFTDRTAPHAHLVEFGTAPRRLEEPHVVELSPGVWATVTHTGSAPAKPFMRPVLDEHQREILRAIATRMAKRMAAEASKMAGRYGTLKKHYKRKLAA